MNILEQKRKLLGHCYMGGGGGSAGGGGTGPGSGGEARAGMGFAGTGSGLSGSGVGAAQAGRGGEGSGGRGPSEADVREAQEAEANRQAIAAQAAREQAAREARDAQMAAEQASREQAARDAQAAADKAAGEQAAREQAAREARESQMAAEQASREQAAREAQAQAAADRARDAREAQEAAERAAVASPLAAMSQAGQMTPENANALANQETVRSYLAQVAKDKEVALSKPGEQYNVNSPNVGTSLTNAALAAVDSGLNQQTTKIGAGKNAEESTRDVTTLTSNIPIASFLGYTGADGDAGISYGEAKQLQALGLGNLTGVNLNNMPGTGLSVTSGDGTPVGGLTYNNPGQTADSVVAATDAAVVAGRVFDAVKNFIPGYGMVTLAADLLSGKKTLGDLVVGIGINKLAPMIGTTPAALTSLINGNFADAITGQLMGYAVKDISKTYGLDPRLTTIGLSELGVPRTVNKALGAGNLNLGTTRAISGAIQSPINAVGNYVGANFGRETSTGDVSDMGDSLDSQIDRAISAGSSQGSSQGSSRLPSGGGFEGQLLGPPLRGPEIPTTPTTPRTPTTPSSPLSTLSIPAIGGGGTSASSDCW